MTKFTADVLLSPGIGDRGGLGHVEVDDGRTVLRHWPRKGDDERQCRVEFDVIDDPSSVWHELIPDVDHLVSVHCVQCHPGGVGGVIFSVSDDAWAAGSYEA